MALTDRETLRGVEDRIDPSDPLPEPNLSPASGLGVRGWFRWAWRSLTSMRTALVLLLILGVAAIPGSVFPQRSADPLAVNDYLEQNPTLGALLDRFGMFGVFGSPWFAAVYLLLFVSLVGCVVPRSSQLWRQWRAGPARPPRRFPDSTPVTRVPAEAETARIAADHLRRARWRVTCGPDWVSAEKGFLREVGNLGFHLSLVAILVAVGAGSLFGWQGNVIVREGQGFANTLTQYDQWDGGRAVDPDDLPPFAFTLESFSVAFERGESQRGAPRDFDAVLALQREPAAAPETVSLRVNEPVRIGGADVYLIGHGYAPRIRVTGADGTVLFDDTVVFLPRDANFTSTGVVKIPDAQPQLAFNGIFAPTAAIDDAGPHSVFPEPDLPGLFLAAFTGDLGLDDGVPRSVYRLDTDGLEQIGLEGMTPGQTWQMPNGASVEFVDVQRFVSLRIADDPGRAWALLAATLIMAGLMVSLFVPRRRIWVRVVDAEATIAGRGRTENASPSRDVADLAQVLTSASATSGPDGSGTGRRQGGDTR